MRKPITKLELNVNNEKIEVMRINDVDYISLTDLARYSNLEEPKIPIQTWMRNKDVISYLGLWEKLNNSDFKGIEFTTFEKEAGYNRFSMSPQKWIKATNAIGIISKSGKYGGGTYAHVDIALEFASWISPEFKLYIITEFKRLKMNEQKEYDWNLKRMLSKINYNIHTDAIKNNLIPDVVTKEQIEMIYASEADIINVALFGMTANEWRNKNKDKEGNIRDYANVAELVCLVNLENLNSVYINDNLNQRDRLIKLNKIAIHQMKLLTIDNRVGELENNELLETK